MSYVKPVVAQVENLTAKLDDKYFSRKITK